MTRTSQVVLVVAVLLLAAMLGLFPLQNFDVWMHLATGRYIVEQGHLPYVHPFNFTAPIRQWIDQEWLSQTLGFLLYERVGVDGLVFLKVFAGALAVGLSLWLAFRRGAAFPVAVALALVAALLIRRRLTVRPHLVTLVLLPLWALLLEWRGRGQGKGLKPLVPRGGEGVQGRGDRPPARWRWRPYLLVGSMALWANLHAGFLSGLILLGLYWVEAMWSWWRSQGTLREERAGEARSLTFLLLACTAATLVNPYGWRLWSYPFALVTMRVYMEYIEEWMRPTLSVQFWAFYAYLALGTLLLLARRRSVRLVDGLVWVVFGGMALSARRHIAPFALVSAPAVAVALSSLRVVRGKDEAEAPSPEAPRRLTRGAGRWSPAPFYLVLAAVLVLAGVQQMLAVCPHPLHPGMRRRFFPFGAARYLREHSRQLPRQLYNSYDWGGYLDWELWPQWSMFIDGECVVFRERVFEDSNTVSLLKPGWSRVLASYEVNCIIRDWEMDNPLPLVGTGEWVTVYWDDVAMVLVRRDQMSAEFLAQNDFSLTNPAWLLRNLPQDDATYEKALRQLAEARRRFGPSGIGYRMRGELLYLRGDYEGALAEFQADIALDPELARSWSSAGDCWRELGWYEEAISCYRTDLRRYPGLLNTRISLAQLYAKQGRTKAAIKELRTALGLPFDDPRLRKRLQAMVVELEGRR